MRRTNFYRFNSDIRNAPYIPKDYPIAYSGYFSKTPTFEEMDLFFIHFQNYRNLFHISVLEEVSKTIKIDDMVTVKYVPISAASFYINNYFPLIKIKSDRTFLTDESSNTEKTFMGYTLKFVVPSIYQNFEPKFLRKCLELTIPWMKEFQWSIFKLERTNSLIFLNVGIDEEHKDKDISSSIYIPVDALLKGDVDKIVKIHTKYFKEYFRENSFRNVPPEKVIYWRNYSLNLLNTDTFKKFCDYMKNGGK